MKIPKALSDAFLFGGRRHFVIVSLFIFFRIGLTIARYPAITIITSIIIPGLLTIGMIKFEVDEDFADLLLPPTSRIFPERDWVEKHVPYEQRPIRLILKNENVMSKESIMAVSLFLHHVRICHSICIPFMVYNKKST